MCIRDRVEGLPPLALGEVFRPFPGLLDVHHQGPGGVPGLEGLQGGAAQAPVPQGGLDGEVDEMGQLLGDQGAGLSLIHI